jgi:hypothetical protein
MIDFTNEQFNEIKQKAEELYKSLGEVYCPYLKENVSFNAQGMEHLKFQKHNQMRPRHIQYVRFKLLHFAPKIVGLSYTLQGLSRRMNFEWIRMNSRTEYILKPVSYYEFVSILEGKRMRVIIKQIEAGQKFYWSIIPFWKQDKITDIRKMSYGNPESD